MTPLVFIAALSPTSDEGGGMKLWLDDLRPAPEGWTWAKDVPEAAAYLARGDVTDASLDHDLGDGEQTGYDLLCWVERCVSSGAWYGPLPRFLIHSSNPVGRDNMAAAIASIGRLHRQWQASA